MTDYRVGETAHYPFRSERFYHADNAWYFLIRGGNAEGPFDKRIEAENALMLYIKTQMRLNHVFQHAEDCPDGKILIT